ncbi:MAG: alpha/beta hydrolase [Gammaproteobacteria bacterium]
MRSNEREYLAGQSTGFRTLDLAGTEFCEHAHGYNRRERCQPDVNGVPAGTRQSDWHRHHHCPRWRLYRIGYDREGRDAARWLQQRGIAVFVLKYRLQRKTTQGQPRNLNEDQACKYGIADGIQAVKVVRQQGAEWGIAPDRVGFMGFSAGGMLASEALLQQDAAARPNFAALIYGAPFGKMPDVPAKLPPVFMAWTQDDTTAGYAMVRLYKALIEAGDKPEAHIYNAGGHGFGMGKQGTTSDHWIDEFYFWLQAQGLTEPEKSNNSNNQHN